MKNWYELLLIEDENKFCSLWAIMRANARKSTRFYQDKCRVYLDEYPEQEKNIQEWYHKNDYFYKRSLKFRNYNNEFKNEELIKEVLREKSKSLKKLQEDFFQKDLYQKVKDTYFERRWVRRN